MSDGEKIVAKLVNAVNNSIHYYPHRYKDLYATGFPRDFDMIYASDFHTMTVGVPYSEIEFHTEYYDFSRMNSFYTIDVHQLNRMKDLSSRAGKPDIVAFSSRIAYEISSFVRSAILHSRLYPYQTAISIENVPENESEIEWRMQSPMYTLVSRNARKMFGT